MMMSVDDPLRKPPSPLPPLLPQGSAYLSLAHGTLVRLLVDLSCPYSSPLSPSPRPLSLHSCTAPSSLPSTCASRPGKQMPWSLPSWVSAVRVPES